MGHGAKCDCMICSVGKKIGMISNKDHSDHPKHKEEDKKVCASCGEVRGKEGSCACA